MERKMWQFILGSTGFILYFIYDINSVRMKNAVLQKFFAAGSILVVVSLIAELYAAWGSCHRKIGTMTGFGLGGFLFLCLLIYTLFFALPFEETYCEENKLRAAYTEGMYGFVPPSGCFMVRRSVFVHVGNGRWMETRDLFFSYDFLELSVYYFSGSVDISTDIF